MLPTKRYFDTYTDEMVSLQDILEKQAIPTGTSLGNLTIENIIGPQSELVVGTNIPIGTTGAPYMGAQYIGATGAVATASGINNLPPVPANCMPAVSTPIVPPNNPYISKHKIMDKIITIAGKIVNKMDDVLYYIDYKIGEIICPFLEKYVFFYNRKG